MDTCPDSRVLAGLVAEDADGDIVITRHARIRMAERGASEDTVRLAVTIGEREPARRGLFLHRLDVPFGGQWHGGRYETMQVAALAAHQPGRLVVVTVYTFFFPPEPSP